MKVSFHAKFIDVEVFIRNRSESKGPVLNIKMKDRIEHKKAYSDDIRKMDFWKRSMKQQFDQEKMNKTGK